MVYRTDWRQTNGGDHWQERINGLLQAQSTFLSTKDASKDVLYEAACEPVSTCQTDQFSFKAYLVRWMADTARLAPFTYDTIMARLRPTAKAAAVQCVGGKTGTYCGMQWTTGTYDGTIGVGQQMAALEVVQANLIQANAGPLSYDTGASSKGDGAAGTEASDSSRDPSQLRAITTSDRVGAAVGTAVVAGLVLAVAVFMVS